MDAGQGITGSVGTDSDLLAVRYVSGPSDYTADCFGRRNTGSGNTESVNVFTVNTTTHELVCTVNSTTGVLAGNVKSLRVRYLTELATGLQYLSASEVTTATAWDKVKMIQVTLTFLNTMPGTGGQDIPWVQMINLMNKAG